MIKRISIVVVLLVSFASTAQEGTFSPYSFLGIGNEGFRGTAESRSMAGLSSTSDSIHLNLQNPAAYGDLSYTALTAGMTINSVSLETNEKSESFAHTTFDYFAIGIPFNKFGIGFGVKPVSAVGYDIRENNSEIRNKYEGEGGLNSVYLSAGAEIFKDFKLGFTANYNFGTLNYNNLIARKEVQYASRELIETDLRGFDFEFGAIKDFQVGKKNYLRLAATFRPEMDLDASVDRRLASVQVFSSDQIIVIDENQMPIKDSELTLPQKTSLSVGFGQKRKWYVGADYVMQKANDFSELTYNFSNDVIYKDREIMRLGGFFIPRYNDPANFLKRLSYRAGIRFEKTGLSYNGKDIEEFGINFGVGIPAGRVFTNANIGVEYFKRGTKSNNLVQEDYISVFLSFSFNDKWFIKSKFN